MHFGTLGSFLILWSKAKLTYIWKRIKFWIWKWVVCVKFSDGRHQLPQKYGMFFTYCMILTYIFFFRDLSRSRFSMLNKSVYISFFLQLAADMQRFSRPERRINGPTISHLWWVIMLPLLFLSLLFIYLFNCFVLDSRSMLKLLDILVQLDHLKNAKASIPNDFSWYKRYAFSFCLCYFIFKLRIFNLCPGSVCFC